MSAKNINVASGALNNTQYLPHQKSANAITTVISPHLYQRGLYKLVVENVQGLQMEEG
jgi:hypothetical protein